MALTPGNRLGPYEAEAPHREIRIFVDSAAALEKRGASLPVAADDELAKAATRYFRELATSIRIPTQRVAPSDTLPTTIVGHVDGCDGPAEGRS